MEKQQKIHDTSFRGIQSVELRLPRDALWGLINPNPLWMSYVGGRTTGEDYVDAFFKLSEKLIDTRILSKTDAPVDPEKDGRLIAFCPGRVMFEGFVESQTESFFDGSDCPPPEFWVGQAGEELISFIPNAYISVAQLGVECNVTNTLRWL